MTTTATTATTAITRPTPRWARRAAHAIALCAVPSGLWRIAMACGVYVGYSDAVLHERYGIPGWGIAYVVGLSVLIECAALLPLLLVSDRWRPRRPGAVGVAAIAATAAVILLELSQVLVYFTVESQSYLSGTASTVAGLAFAPLFAVGPLAALVTWSYWRRVVAALAVSRTR
ncbi:hypothetical protein [Streptomyces apocyni]|uniref:hypothetical protein n=1 Tax=Streptomyces apocyni TaxID=2654677 RepID=UPI0012EA7654|nr:hypothetical protein [Streptomyces apocyni]